VSPGHHLRPQRVLGIILLVAVTLTGCAGGNTAAPTSPTTSTAVVPRADKPVSYLGLTIDVPRSWTVAERVDAFCGIPGPGVIVGASPPPQKTLIQCAAVLLRGTVVTLGGPDPPGPTLGPATDETVHGIRTSVSEGRGGTQGTSTIWQEWVRFPSHAAWLEMKALGPTERSALAPAQHVLATVHIATETP
jgi:hypothetical protein